MKDEVLLDRWRRQQPEALAELVTEYSRPFYGFLAVLLGGTQKTADDFFFKAFQKVLSEAAKDHAPTSIFLKLLKYAVKETKPSAAVPRTSLEPPVLAKLSNDEEIQLRILLSLKILAGMNLEERMVILLRDLMELDVPEMAYVLDMQEDHLKSRLNEARIHFREKMNESLRSKDFYDLRKH